VVRVPPLEYSAPASSFVELARIDSPGAITMAACASRFLCRSAALGAAKRNVRHTIERTACLWAGWQRRVYLYLELRREVS
jgi:hypothetical protein